MSNPPSGKAQRRSCGCPPRDRGHIEADLLEHGNPVGEYALDGEEDEHHCGGVQHEAAIPQQCARQGVLSSGRMW